MRCEWYCSHTFQVINGLFQFGHCPLCKLCTGLSLTETQTQYVTRWETSYEAVMSTYRTIGFQKLLLVRDENLKGSMRADVQKRSLARFHDHDPIVVPLFFLVSQTWLLLICFTFKTVCAKSVYTSAISELFFWIKSSFLLWDYQTQDLTSFSLSVRTLISSSYLSSFSEYCWQTQRNRIT